MDIALRAIEAADEAPSLSKHLEREGTRAQLLEFVVHRSAYQLKEADPHSWALPRLSGPPKAAMVEIQADEYGGGRAERIHAALFAKTMDRLGLDSTYGAYLDLIPGVTLATVNLMSLFGLHRRWRGALVGHLALFEMTSSVPNRRYGAALRRVGADDETVDFFDEHVTADAVHEAIAAVDLAGGLARQDPALTPDILWGAQRAHRARGPLGAPRCWRRGRRGARRCSRRSRRRRRASARAEPARARPRARSARGSARPCASRRRTAAAATCRSGTARPSSRPASISLPSWSSSRNGPRTSRGPSRYGVIVASSMAGAFPAAAPGKPRAF